jgi:hypothetical protein
MGAEAISAPVGAATFVGGMASHPMGGEMAMGRVGVGSSLDHAIGPTAPMGIPEIGVGGSHLPELNPDIFSQTTVDWQRSPTHVDSGLKNDIFTTTIELKSPPIESFDKITPNDLLAHSAVLWQAPAEAKTETATSLQNIFKESADDVHAKNEIINSILEEPISEIEVPLTIREEDNSFQIQDILNTYMTRESLVTQPSTNMPEMAEEKPIEMQELKADVLQSVKVEKALASAETNPQEAKEQTVKILTQVENEKGITEVLRKKLPQPPTEIKFEHDSEADKNRGKIITEAIKKVDAEVESGKTEKITGKAIVNIMPKDQPESVKSKILTRTQNDGSYENLIVDLSKVGELPNGTAGQEVEKLIAANHAVKLGNANQATEKEVKKVLNGKSSL